MQTILVANPKGGSGKTTLATNIAGWLAGKRQRVVLPDPDPQRSSTQWLERRPALFPPIAGLRAATRQEGAEGSRHALAGHRHRRPALHGDDLRDAVRRADVMLVPLSPSAFDMAATARLPRARSHEHKAVQEGELALGLVAMRVDARTRARGRARRVPRSTSSSRWSRTCATRRSTSTARATGCRCSTCRARAASRTGSSGSR